MTKGIRVIWPDENGDIDEIEYFCGIDVDNLDSIPAFSSVRADWPRYEGGTRVDYTIDVGIERPRGGEVNLVIDYHEAKNPKLAERRRVASKWPRRISSSLTRSLEKKR